MKLTPQPLSKRMWRLALIIVMVASMILPGTLKTAQAGKEGVFLSDSVYFTLEEARLSPGEDNQNFLFTLELVNHSDQVVNYNNYGVAVLDGEGNRYSAELTGKMSSRIKPGSSVMIKYASRVPTGLTLSDLQAQIFEWNFSSRGYMDPIGSLSVASATKMAESVKPQTVINLNSVDSSYATDAMVAIQLEDSFRVLTNGTWNQYVLLNVENLGSGSFKLPSALQIQLKDQDELTYTGTLLYGGEETILPRQSKLVTVQFPVGNLPDGYSFILELGKKTTSSATSTNSSSTSSASNSNAATGTTSSVNVTVLGSMVLPSASAAQAAERDYSGQAGLKSSIAAMSVVTKSTGVHMKADWKLENKGAKAISLPTFSASYQLSGSTLSVTATDSLTHPTYLAAGEYTTYRFEADLPSGVDPSSVQLAVQEKKGTTTTVLVPSYVAWIPEGGASTGGSTEPGGDIYQTTVGKLAMQVKTSYRLMTESGDDVLMTEVQVENKESGVVKLPALYTKYESGDLSVDGKAVRVQSSPYLNPGAKTVLYFYALVPYDIAIQDGTFTFGEGSIDSKTNEVTFTKEWAKLNFSLSANAVADAPMNSEFVLSDAGRQSSAKVVDTKVYDTDNGKIAAVRIAQKNLETRGHTSVPYAGYFIGEDQMVYKATATEETGNVGKDGWSLSTLWVTLPNNVEVPNKIIFGPKLDDKTLTAPRQLTATSWKDAEQSSKFYESNGLKATISPYKVAFKNMSGTISGSNYEISFYYEVSKDYDVTVGSMKNRYYHITLEDITGTVYKTWDIPVLGVGSFDENSSNKITVEKLTTNDFVNLVISGRLKIYEKFEGGTRLLGTITTK
ncbi:hypothetical protein [Gorillibacterium sp. sgz5001074]|uniref:hypothetical protein n=1 Tax=Gorillibacterium sp. sgz5001074 TaxID=3446695 RepID=UPI003F66F47E